MKAIVCTGYGPPEVLQFSEIDKPVPGDNEVLIRVVAAVATPSDCAFRAGKPFIVRLLYGLRRPRISVMGTELAGVIEATGSGVTRFQAGDAVVAATSTSFGAYAEYVCQAEDTVIALKPARMTFGEAAALCEGGLTAQAFIREHGRLQAGQKILINGASGSIGTAAVQLAGATGAHVTGVCSTANVALVRSLGADQVIDYTREDFTAARETYDVIFDAVGKSSFRRCRGALKPGGIYLTTVPSLSIVLAMAGTALAGDKKAVFAATGLSRKQQDLVDLVELADAGAIRSVIDRDYPWEAVAEAHRYVDTGRKRGNVVLSVGQPDAPRQASFPAAEAASVPVVAQAG